MASLRRLLLLLLLLLGCASLFACVSGAAPGLDSASWFFSVSLPRPWVSRGLFLASQHGSRADTTLRTTLFVASRDRVLAFDPNSSTSSLRANLSLEVSHAAADPAANPESPPQSEPLAPQLPDGCTFSAGRLVTDELGGVWAVSASAQSVLHFVPTSSSNTANSDGIPPSAPTSAFELSESFIDLTAARMGPAESVVLAPLVRSAENNVIEIGVVVYALRVLDETEPPTTPPPSPAPAARVATLALFDATGVEVWRRDDLGAEEGGCQAAPNKLQILVPNDGRPLVPGSPAPDIWVACGSVVFAINSTDGTVLATFPYSAPEEFDPTLVSDSPETGDVFVSYRTAADGTGPTYLDRLTVPVEGVSPPPTGESGTGTGDGTGQQQPSPSHPDFGPHGMLSPVRGSSSPPLNTDVMQVSALGIVVLEDSKACRINDAPCHDELLLQVMSASPVSPDDVSTPRQQWLAAYTPAPASVNTEPGQVQEQAQAPALKWDTWSSLPVGSPTSSVPSMPIRVSPSLIAWVVRDNHGVLPRVLYIRTRDGCVERSFDLAHVGLQIAEQPAPSSPTDLVPPPPNCVLLGVTATKTLLLDCAEVFTGHIVALSDINPEWEIHNTTLCEVAFDAAHTVANVTDSSSSSSSSSTGADDSSAAESSSGVSSSTGEADDADASAEGGATADPETGEDVDDASSSSSSSTASAAGEETGNGGEEDDGNEDSGPVVPLPTDGEDESVSESSSSSSGGNSSSSSSGGAGTLNDDGSNELVYASNDDGTGGLNPLWRRLLVALFAALMVCAVIVLLWQWCVRRRRDSSLGRHVRLSQKDADAPHNASSDGRRVGAGLHLDGTIDDGEEEEYYDDGGESAFDARRQHGANGGAALPHQDRSQLSAHDVQMLELEEAIGKGFAAGLDDVDDDGQSGNEELDLEALRALDNNDGDTGGGAEQPHPQGGGDDDEDTFRIAIGHTASEQ